MLFLRGKIRVCLGFDFTNVSDSLPEVSQNQSLTTTNGVRGEKPVGLDPIARGVGARNVAYTLMKIDPPEDDALIINSAGVGTVTRKMVRERAVELALIDGRTAQEVSKSDWEPAKRELTGGSDMDPNEELLESAPESERWDPLPGSTGHIVPVNSVDGEDEDGRSFTERLVDEGMLEAEHDQMRQAAKKQQQDGK